MKFLWCNMMFCDGIMSKKSLFSCYPVPELNVILLLFETLQTFFIIFFRWHRFCYFCYLLFCNLFLFVKIMLKKKKVLFSSFWIYRFFAMTFFFLCYFLNVCQPLVFFTILYDGCHKSAKRGYKWSLINIIKQKQLWFSKELL